MNNPEREKYLELEVIRSEVDRTRDKRGKSVDEGIKEAVVFMKALGVTLDGSCEGHFEEPAVGYDAQGTKHEWRQTQGPFLGIRNIPKYSAEEAVRIKANSAELDNLLKICEENNQRVRKLLTDFYKQAGAPEEEIYQLHPSRDSIESFTIEARGQRQLEGMTRQEKEVFVQGAQDEMKRFTEFLTERYHGGE